MKCLCCGKDVYVGDWHKSCIKKMFGQDVIPNIEINLDDESSKQLLNGKGVTGVQPKFSKTISVISAKKTVKYSYEFILKPNTNEYPNIAECEALVMSMARCSKIETPLFGLIKDKRGEYVYIVKRFDRINGEKIHVEDFCQLLGTPTEYKYIGSYEKCARNIIDKYSTQPGLDKSYFFERILFSYITLNSDMHLKNFSLIEEENRNRMSPQYDLLPVQLIYPDSEDTALTLNGKKKNLRRKDFIIFGESIGLVKCEKMIDKYIGMVDTYVSLIEESSLDDKTKLKFINAMKDRINKLKKNNA